MARRSLHRIVVRVAKATIAFVVGLILCAVLTLWAIHRVPWLGPLIADSLRVVLGPGVVATLEDWLYDVEDRWQRTSRTTEPPREYWDASRTFVPVQPDATRTFAPIDVGPMLRAAPNDGFWVPVAVDNDEGTPLLFKTLLHPDTTRSWAELFVVAIDVSRVRVFAVAGSIDPESETDEGKRCSRPARIPADRQLTLLAAFNGGWKAENGHFGMKVDGVTLLAPKADACTFAAYDDDTLRIASWTRMADTEPKMRFFRQTPPCLFAGGARHPGLGATNTPRWGAAVGGNAVIRRSAVGLSLDGTTLFVGVSNATTAPAIADGMRHAGASDVAMLDVNWSYPKFLVFRRNASGELEADGLFPGFVFEKDEYVRTRAPKDFFYLVRR